MAEHIENNFLFESIIIQYNKKQTRVLVYDTPLGKRWLEALRDNLKQKRILEKNFCFLGWADNKRNLTYLCEELNKNIAQINSFNFNPPYKKIKSFSNEDFQYPDTLPVGFERWVGREIHGNFPGLKLKHEACNKLHRHFEELQGTAWTLSPYYKIADNKTKYAIRQLNNLPNYKLLLSHFYIIAIY